jgi:hypothetical protein
LPQNQAPRFRHEPDESEARMANISLVIPAAPGIHVDALESVVRQTRPVEVIVEEGPNPSANRNRGAARAAAPLIAFINAHTVLRADWAERVEHFFQQHPEVDIVGGPQLNYDGDPYFARLSGDALASPFCTGQMSRRYRPSVVNLEADETSLSSANLICRRSVFERVRFDEALYPGEDPKFITDAKRAGLKVACASDIVVFNRRRGDLLRLWKQVFHYGASRVQKETPVELLSHPVFFAPAAFALYAVTLPVLLAMFPWAWVPAAAYGALSLAFALARALDCRRAEYLLLLPPVFLWIHLAYGAGFLGSLLGGRWARHRK